MVRSSSSLSYNKKRWWYFVSVERFVPSDLNSSSVVDLGVLDLFSFIFILYKVQQPALNPYYNKNKRKVVFTKLEAKVQFTPEGKIEEFLTETS